MGETQFFLIIGTFEKFLEMKETQFLLFIGTFKKCKEMGETQFLPFIGTFENCLEMGENGFLFSPISWHFLLFLLFLDTFSFISGPKSVYNKKKNDPATLVAR